MPDIEPSNRREILRHPMIIVLVSFLFSGLLAAVFSQWLGNQAEKAERNRILAESRKTAVQNLSRYIYERRVRAVMLVSAFRRNAPLSIIKQRKQLYDETFVEWSTSHPANLFLIRDILQETDYSYIESVVESTLVLKIFGPLDRCLTRAYDASIVGSDPIQILNKCQSDRLLKKALACGYAITNELYKLSSGVSNQADAEREIRRSCPN